MTLLQLLFSITDIDINKVGRAKVIVFSRIVEVIYYTVNTKMVLPNHFLENLLHSSFTNCKSYISFLENRSPGGSYTYINNWLKEQGKEPLTYPSGLVKSVFDNSKKICRTYLVSETTIKQV